MARVWRVMVRFMTIVAGYLIACFASALAMVFVAAMREARTPIIWSEFFTSSHGWGAVFAYAMFALALILPVSLIPTAVAIVYAERYRLRAFAAFAGFGAVIGIAGYWYVMVYVKQWHSFGSFSLGVGPFWLGESLFFALFGLFGGTVYWLLAGRRSGNASG